MTEIRQSLLSRPGFLSNAIPKALSAKLGVEKVSELCIRYGYRSRKENRLTRCPECGSFQVYFRTGALDGVRGIRCRKCKHIKVVSRI